MIKPNHAVRGFIFDMDGTLIDSKLDFDAIRQDIGLAKGLPILESLESMESNRRIECENILLRHEQQGVRDATVFPNVAESLLSIERLQLPMAIVTRNRADFAAEMLVLLPVTFDIIIGRDDGPIKPDPWAPLHICQQWGIEPSESVMIGDFVFDIQSGNAAGCFTVLYTQGRDHSEIRGTEEADWIMDDFTQLHMQLDDWARQAG
ncbi:MAG: HAD family hydrolase [Pirellulaceae bacterium]